MEYYVFSTQAEADSCLSYINGTDWFPLFGKSSGTIQYNRQATTCWATESLETRSGEWAVPRIPESRLDYVKVPQVDRDAFLAAFGQDIRELQSEDFVE